MQNYSNSSAYDLIQRLEEFPAGCDPDFDSEFEELEREFAELRMTFNHH
jgi:hypothetical protein